MTFIFDRETRLTSAGVDQFTLINSPHYQNPFGVFGGWVAAVQARAVEQHSDFRGPVLSIQIHYVAAPAGEQLRISVRLIRRGGKLDFWRTELFDADKLCSVADIIAGSKKDSQLNVQQPMPDVPPPEQLAPAQENGLRPVWFPLYDRRHLLRAVGKPGTLPESLCWIREADGRPLDRASLIAFLDTPPPRTFLIAERPTPGSTLAMATYIYASDAALAAVGNDYVLMRVDGATAQDSLYDQRIELWSRTGQLLATSNQVGLFREM